ncbi:MAG TPA: hypothetical protein VJV05_05110 [Pyrinomonadaceae bacterium]|nr:hypothetical protein [Pyrinomonadaceae bacterium]
MKELHFPGVIEHTRVEATDRRFAVDTTFVLFFLAVDFGQSSELLSVNSALSLVTLGMVLVLPYFLPTDAEKPDFTNWVLGRSLIAVFAVVLGMMFQQSLGVLLPAALGFLPFTLLILTGMVSSYLQFCAIIRFRLAR